MSCLKLEDHCCFVECCAANCLWNLVTAIRLVFECWFWGQLIQVFACNCCLFSRLYCLRKGTWSGPPCGNILTCLCCKCNATGRVMLCWWCSHALKLTSCFWDPTLGGYLLASSIAHDVCSCMPQTDSCNGILEGISSIAGMSRLNWLPTIIRYPSCIPEFLTNFSRAY